MKIEMLRRRLSIPILHIDTNLINARQGIDAVNLLEKWCSNDVILINMSSTAHAEAQAGGNHLRTRKANQQIFTVTEAAGPEDAEFQQVEAILFPGGAKDENQKNDVRIVCEAAKYQAILVTGDGASKTQPGGILGNREKLRDRVQILSADEAVALVRKNILERDQFNERVARECGGELPEWTGKD